MGGLAPAEAHAPVAALAPLPSFANRRFLRLFPLHGHPPSFMLLFSDGQVFTLRRTSEETIHLRPLR
jgi:hypothetical protein